MPSRVLPGQSIIIACFALPGNLANRKNRSPACSLGGRRARTAAPV
jgi:hypothetical protein